MRAEERNESVREMNVGRVNLSRPKEAPKRKPAVWLHAWRDPLRDKRSGQGALDHRHTDGQLWAALLKTTVTCEAWGRRTMLLQILLFLQELRLFVGPKTNPDTDTGTGPIQPVT